jgi:hypothetical protein
MVNGRTYVVSFSAVAVTAVQDFFYFKAASDKPISPAKVVISVDSSETNEQLKISMKRLPATVTAGSGGSAPTPEKTSPGQGSAGFTARINDTTQATSSGTAVRLTPEGWPSQGGFEYKPDVFERVQFSSSEACVFSLDVAPGSSVNVSGYAFIEELG